MKTHDPAEEIVALRDEVAQFRLLSNNVPVAIAYFEAGSFACRYANRGYANMFGFDETTIVDRTFAQIIGEAAAQQIQPQVDTVLRERRRASYERQLPDDDSGPRWIEVDLLPHLNGEGAAVGAFVLIGDISRHRRAEIALRQSEERLAKFMHASAEGIVFHRDGIVSDANPPLLALIGYTLDELRGTPALQYVAPDQTARVRDVMLAGAEIAYDTAVLHRDGTRIPVEFIVRTLRHGGERLRMTIVRDLRDRLDAQARIHHLAHHDALTGLPNRLSFGEQTAQRLAQARQQEQTLALLFIDLDHFKRVNDSLGHLAGDELLRAVAQRITGCLRSGDLVARFAGDEFVVLLAGGTPVEAVREIAHKLVAAVGAPVELAGAAISVTPTIGVALFPAHGDSAEELVQHADTAMYHAKAGGRAGLRFFEPAMADAARRALAVEMQLTRAIRERQFVLHFQPQVSLRRGALAGCEALLRWHHPEHGLVGPDAFIPLAEARRLMLPIGRWALRETVRHSLRWRRLGLLDVPLSVNLSALQFQAGGFVDEIEQVLAEEGADGTMLELELTERMLMDDIAAVRGRLQRLRAIGVTVAVDDFGSGYTSLARLKDLPLDRLKIDRQFVAGLPGDAAMAAITGAVIQMARGLGMRTLAKGVETEAQHDWLATRGCDEQQGFLVAQPMDAAALQAWLQARRPPD